MRVLFVFVLSLVTFSAIGQRVTVRGVLLDSAGNVLPSATVLLLSAKDSTLVNFAPSDASGGFQLKNLQRMHYLLKVSYVGFRTFVRDLNLLEMNESLVDVGRLTMEARVNELDEVTVTAERAPVVIKKDTIEFDAGSFKTKENAVVEDLLKKLPGVEVDNDGTIRSQGEQVRRVTVDGKTFFGNDPKLATRNLPADAISKVQVYDRKSDQVAFTGIDDGQREKTINLELKEEKRKGAFGSITAGAGSEERFEGKASINRFRKGNQLSFLGQANNVNQQGFGIEEYMNFTGGSRQMMGGRGGAIRLQFGSDNQNGIPLSFGNRNSGIMTSYAAGVNMNRDLKKGTELNTSYFYNHIRGELATDLERINYLPDDRQNTSVQSSSRISANHNHRVNTTLDHKIDSMNSLRLTAGFTFNTTSMDEAGTSSLTNEYGEVVNSGSRFTTSDGDNTALNATLLWRHRFEKKGRTLAATGVFNFREVQRSGTQDATLTSGNETTQLVQANTQDVQNTTYSLSLSFTEPLGNRRYLEGNYTFRENDNDFERYVYDVDGSESEFNAAMSNKYRSAYWYHKGGINFRMNGTRYSLTTGASVQHTSLNGKLILQNADVSKSFVNVLPVLRFNYEFSNTRRVTLDYETNVTEPSIEQLQPTIDNSDPFNLYVGNPDLQPAYVQSLRLNANAFNPVSFVSVFGFIQASLTDNAIIMSQSFTPEGVRVSRPVNVDNNKSLMANVSVGFPIRPLKSRVSLTARANHQSGPVLVNDTENSVAQNTMGGRIRYDFQFKETLDLSVGTDVSRQSSVFSSAEQADQLFFNNTFTSEANLKFLKRFALNGSFEYLVYRNVTDHSRQSVPLVNLSLSGFLLNAKSGELRLSVVNVLNRNVGYSQSATLNYFERERTNNLGRYIMVSFIYSLNKQLNPLGGGGPRGNMIRITR